MKLVYIVSSILLMSLTAQNGFAQYVNEQVTEKMENLSFMTGKWKGNGWMLQRDGSKAEFNQTENIYFKLSNTLLVIEGRGTEPRTGDVVHDAFAIISYQPGDTLYRFESFLSNGRGTTTSGKIENEQTFVWWIDQPNGARILYTIDFSEKERWKESATYLPDPKAEAGRKFLEMTLKKVKE